MGILTNSPRPQAPSVPLSEHLWRRVQLTCDIARTMFMIKFEDEDSKVRGWQNVRSRNGRTNMAQAHIGGLISSHAPLQTVKTRGRGEESCDDHWQLVRAEIRDVTRRESLVEMDGANSHNGWRVRTPICALSPSCIFCLHRIEYQVLRLGAAPPPKVYLLVIWRE